MFFVQSIDKTAAFTKVFYHIKFYFSRDCPIFYMRRKVQKDLADQDRIISRFNVAPLNW